MDMLAWVSYRIARDGYVHMDVLWKSIELICWHGFLMN